MSNVVPFSRSAEYLHQRALKNRRDQHLLDALELLRRALEQDEFNPEYQMDLAETYCEMGCHLESNRILTRILTLGQPSNECLFGMSCNFYGMNDLETSHKALMCFLSDEPAAVQRPEVSDMLHTVLMARELNERSGRRQARAERLARRGGELLNGGDGSGAERLFRRSLQVNPHQGEARALLARCLAEGGQPEQAVREALRAVRVGHPEIRTLCMVAGVFRQAGRMPLALRAVDMAAARKPEGDELRLLLDALCDLNLHERAFELSLRALREAPYDRRLLHLHAAALLNSGRPAEQALRCWARIRRIDPRDVVAAYYISADLSKEIPVSYAYRLPEAECARRMHRMHAASAAGASGVRTAWEQDRDFARTLRWALDSGDARLTRTALNLFVPLAYPEADCLLRDFLLRPDASQALKRQALMVLGMHGAMPPYLASGFDKFLLTYPDDSGQMPSLPPGYRRVLKLALRIMTPAHQELLPPVTLSWLRFTFSFDENRPPLRDPECWAAALAHLYLSRCQPPVPVEETAAMLGCRPRKVLHLAKRIQCLAPPMNISVEREDEQS